MTTSKWEARAAAETLLSSALDSLASAGRKITSTAVDNSSSDKLALYGEFELYVAAQGSARSAGAYVELYILPELDGSNYSYGGDSLTPAAQSLVGVFGLDAATTARYVIIPNVMLPPTSFHVLVINQTGQAFAASGNTLKLRRYNIQSN